jgi:transcriptional regulator with XRE-family HTH domain
MGFSPRIRRERLAAELKALRGKMTTSALAATIGCSQSRIARLENLTALPDVGLVMDILDALGVADQAKRDQLVTLAREGSKRGWWRAFTGMPAAQAGRAELESGTATIREYAAVYVPGLLQSPSYALVRFEDRDAYHEFNVEEALAGRQKRQEILTTDNPVHYEAILDEAVFRRRTAPDEIMRAQIDHLLRIAQLANVTVRVLPFGATTECHAFPFTSFSLYEFADPADPQMVAVETDSSDLHLGDQEDLDRHRLTYERIEAASLEADESRRFIEGARP